MTPAFCPTTPVPSASDRSGGQLRSGGLAAAGRPEQAVPVEIVPSLWV